MANSNENNTVQCTNCMEWEYFEGCGYGCFAMRTMTPLDAEKCEFFTNRDKWTIPSFHNKKTHEPHIAK